MNLRESIPYAILFCVCACDQAPPAAAATVLPLGKADGLTVDPRGAIAFDEVKTAAPIDVGEYHGYDFVALAGGCMDIELDAEVKEDPDTYLFLLQEASNGDDGHAPRNAARLVIPALVGAE